MSRIEKRVCITPGVERLFTYVPESTDMMQLWPGLLEVGEVERLPEGGALARWLYKSTGAIFEELGKRSEPLFDHNNALMKSGGVECVMKWHYRSHTCALALILNGVHTYWSPC